MAKKIERLTDEELDVITLIEQDIELNESQEIVADRLISRGYLYKKTVLELTYKGLQATKNAY